MTNAELEKQADKVMEDFNFQMVHAYMKLVGWKWQMSEELRVPTLEEIRLQARSLLTRVIYDESMLCGTGGFVAYRFPWGLELNFCLTRSSGA